MLFDRSILEKTATFVATAITFLSVIVFVVGAIAITLDTSSNGYSAFELSSQAKSAQAKLHSAP